MTRKIACITLDVEADFLDPMGRIRLFEDESLFERYASVLRKRGVKLTAFLVTSLIDKHAAAYQRLSRQVPVEFAIHSHAHDMQNPCSRRDIELAVRTFRDFTGGNPIGYRAPVGQITREGMETLMDLGFRYDSSIYPSARPGKWGYNNMHLPVTPFRVRQGARSILEVPFASLTFIRLNFSLSYVKLFGWRTYQLLLKLFPLPGQVAVLSHPHDYYFHLLKNEVTATEKPLLLRNAGAAFELLEKMLDYLAQSGYEFEFLSGLCDALDANGLTEIALERVTGPGVPGPTRMRP
jgi:peptidoglycan/xylan/chitin deacetylase (PgdA/CDA1 family)